MISNTVQPTRQLSGELDKKIKSPSPSPTSVHRRTIFNDFWRKSSSVHDADASSAARVERSYLGIYSFAPPSPLISPKPLISPLSRSSNDMSAASPSTPKSILRRHHSSHCQMEGDTESILPELPFAPKSLEQEEDSLSKDSSSGSATNNVHFDPTVTIREPVNPKDNDSKSNSNWFSEAELQVFFREATNLCRASAINSIKSYSPHEVAQDHIRAVQSGGKGPVVHSELLENRALFTNPILHATDEDFIVHDKSSTFFKISYKMVRRVLIVDSSRSNSELLRDSIIHMFPHVAIDMAVNGEDALSRMQLGDMGDMTAHGYDIVIIEHRSESLEGLEHKNVQKVTDSLLLHLIKSSEDSTMQEISLIIGESANMSEDCEQITRAGADLLWAKPPPKPSNSLRNQLLNILLNKRGKSIFICG